MNAARFPCFSLCTPICMVALEPSRTRLSVARAIATTLAREIWPASSTNRTSTASTILDEAHSHEVPAARLEKYLAADPGVILTDQYAPVDNLMADVFRNR